MSFLGFVAFSTAPGGEAAEQALRRWLTASAASADVQDWTSAASRGCFSSFSLVPGADHFATVARDAGLRFVGDVPASWSTGPAAPARRARMAAAPAGESLDDMLPETEFSMGLWDERASQLTLYRCPLGARALFYVCEPRQWIAFASLPEPLLALPGVRDVIDEAALPSQLMLGYAETAPPGATLFAPLRRLPAGHRLRVTEAGVSTEEYWRLPRPSRHAFGPDDPEVPRVMRRLLDQAVRRRVKSLDRVGTQLSGGIDSSAVTALAYEQRDSGAGLFVYTIRSYDQHGDVISSLERELADALIARLDGAVARDVPHGKANRPFYLDQQEYLERPLPDMVFKLSADHRLHAAARRDGCKTVLTGWGGDEMASARGSLHVLAMIAEGRWDLAWRNLMYPDGWSGSLRALKRDIVGPLWSGLRANRRWSDADFAALRPVFAGKPLAGAVVNPTASRDWLLRRRRRNRVSSPAFRVSLELHDWLGQRAGVAVRHPLLDRDLIEFCDAMPPEWVAHLGVKRRAFRSALAGVIPPAHVSREKAPLTRPAEHRRWFERYRAHQFRAVRDLAASDTWLHRYLNLGVLAAAQEALQGGSRDAVRPIAQLGAGALVVARHGARPDQRSRS